jgi:ribosomal protein S18 acetylase RimI-like enzyme
MDVLLKLRPVRPEDEPFLQALRAQIDAERLGLQYWSPEAAELARQIVDLQFRAHRAHYRRVKSNWDTKDCVIEVAGQPVGRFIVTQGSREIYLADIAVDRAHRGRGIGQAVIDGTKAECIQSKRVLRLHVDPHNEALRFYLGLGFREIERHPTHLLMEWVPPNLLGRTRVFGPARS